jgi:hypothetical protein
VNEELDERLESAARASHEVRPELLASVADSIRPAMKPVRPLAPAWLLTAAAAMVCAAVALAGAVRFGFLGFEKLGIVARVSIFIALGLLLFVAAREFVGQMIPGSRHRVTPAALLQITIVALITLFALLFRDYHTIDFFSAGVVCLSVGLLHAAPAALLCWFVLRRGFAVNPVGAGLAAGILGGLAGVTMLELHCPNFEALHIIVWHTAVVPASGALGALCAWLLHRRPSGTARSAG